MKYQTLDRLKVKTSQGDMELQAGQIITLPHELAIRLLNEGKIAPIEKVAYRIYSEILQSYLWVISDDNDREAVRAFQGVSEAIYTADEIKKLKGMDKDSLKVIHKVKEVFKNSKVEEITTKENHEC